MKFQNYLIFTLLGLTSFFHSHAQTAFGIKAGLNFANQSFSGIADDTLNVSGITGVSIGALVQLDISEFFAVQPEVNFIQKGSKTVTEIQDGGPVSFSRIRETKFSYLDIPLLLKISLGSDDLKIYGVAGPTFGFALKGDYEETTEINGVKDVDEGSIEFDDSPYKRFELGGAAGVGVRLNLGGAIAIFADGRYLLGFSDLEDSDEDITIRNKGVNVNAGILFSFE